jgi:excisionase family DNA binding protein
LAADRLLTYRDVARRLAVSDRTARRIVERGELRKVRIGGCVRFRPEDVVALIKDDDAPEGARRVMGAAVGGGSREPS